MESKKIKVFVIIITILSLIVMGLSGYIVYDKVLNNRNVNKENNLNNENNENNNVIDEKEDDDENNNVIDEKVDDDENNLVTNDLIKVMKEDYNLLFKVVDQKYFGTYTKVGNDYKHVLVLKDKNPTTGWYEFEMNMILTEGIAKLKGTYVMFNNKLVLYTEPYQYAGWVGDLKWRREFKVNEDGSLTFVDNDKDMGDDMIKYGDVFKK
jgi:hypothetical protein